MSTSPLILEPLFHIGPVPITTPVVTTTGIVILMGLGGALAQRRLARVPSKLQAFLEIIVTSIDYQIRETLERDPAPYRAFIGTIFLFVLCANWTGLLPGLEPPTAHLETDAALALLVFAATVYFGVRAQKIGGYLKTFAQPSIAMLPLNLIEQVTRTFSLIVRLFGNVTSGVFVIGIIMSLAGLFVPIPLMALDLLTGAVQAYIFATLATVFIGAAISGHGAPPNEGKDA
jgi:F-type H+-transporting ATPase subunit a